MTSKQSTDLSQSSLSLKLKTSSNFCIDALLAKEDPIRASSSSESLNSESNPASLQDYVPSPDSRSDQSPEVEVNGGSNCDLSLNGADQSSSNKQSSPLWTPRLTSSLTMAHPLTSSTSSSTSNHPSLQSANQQPHHSNQPHTTAANTSLSSPTPVSLFSSSVTNHPLYASLYESLQNSNGSSSIGLIHQNQSLSLIHGSAFHSPLHDIKAHHSSPALPLEWLTRAGLLYHRNTGEYHALILFTFLP
jgi:hypothetical protein